MARLPGSAAAALEATPESAVEASRQHLRAVLPQHLEQLQRTLSLAAGALSGPDPEASLGFLQLLDEHLQRALRSAR
jgi:hypothetical protein